MREPGVLVRDTARRRAEHRNSKSGRLTCKERHIRCDEQTPVCGRCKKGGRPCIVDYRASQPRQFRGFKAVNPAISLTPSRSKEQKSLEFFRERSLPTLCEFEPSLIWDAVRDMLRPEISPVVDVATAIGHQHMLLAAAQDQSDGQDLQATYTKAITSLRSSMNMATDQDMHHILVASVLLSVLQSMRGSLFESMVSLYGGIHLAQEQLQGNDDALLRECLRLLEKITLKIVILESRSETGRQAVVMLTDLWHSTAGDEPLFEHACDDAQDVHIMERDITRGLLRVIRDCHSTIDSRTTRQSSLTPSQEAIVALLRHKQGRLEAQLQVDLQVAQEQNHKVKVVLYRFSVARCLLLKVFLECAWAGTQVVYDSHLNTYVAILDLIDQALEGLHQDRADISPMACSFGLGAIPTLVLVASKCRDKAIRERAVSLLAKCPPREGIWTAHEAKALCRSLIAYEERKAAESDRWKSELGKIPEDCRIHHHLVTRCESGTGEQSVTLTVFRAGPDPKRFICDEINVFGS